LIFVDSNIPMYLIGAAHPHKTEAQVILERLIAEGQRLVTDAEVLQEILHRYTAIEKREWQYLDRLPETVDIDASGFLAVITVRIKLC